MASTIYCCALTLCYLLFDAYAHHEIAFPCITPNAEFGVCISIFSCPILMKSIGTLHPQAIQFVKNSICCAAAWYDLKVCCGTHGNYLGFEEVTQVVPTQLPPTTSRPQESVTQQTSLLPVSTPLTTEIAIELNTEMLSTTALLSSTPTSSVENRPTQQQQENRNYVKEKLLPSLRYCGLQHTDDRFYTGNITALDEFPWLVHVIFLPDEDEDPYQYLDRCNGVLLNNRYILTIGVCASQAPAVRLGQHNVNKTISCILDPKLPECSEPRYDISVEEEIHRSPDVTEHDFALLRLN